jgi:hypothetical protein
VLAFLAAVIAAAPVAAQVAAPIGTKQIEIPPNGQLNVRGDGWVCGYGYRRIGAGCAEIAVPRNAILGPYGDTWACLPGYYTYRGVCLVEEGAERAPASTKSRVPKAWQFVSKLTASAPPKAPRDRSLFGIAPLVAAAMALGLWMYFFGDREPVVRAREYTRTAIIVQRPQRAVTAISAWRSAGDRVDALTGALIPDAMEAAQCRNCRVFYRRESLVVLRRQNVGSCIACGRQAFQTVAASG